MVDNEEIGMIVDAVSKQITRQVYNMLHSFSWYIIQMVEGNEFDTITIPSFEDAIRD